MSVLCFVRYSLTASSITRFPVRTLHSLVSRYHHIQPFKEYRTPRKMEYDENDDPELAAAIRESMKYQPGGHPFVDHRNPLNDVVDLTGDSDDGNNSAHQNDLINLEEESDDEDLKRAIALSMQQTGMSEEPEEIPESVDEVEIINNPIPKKPISEEKTTATQNSSAFGLLGLDRKILEEERLARVAKRKADQSISPPPLSRERKVARKTVSPSPSGALQTVLQASDSKAASREGNGVNAAPSSRPSIQFPKGAVKKTWVFGCPRSSDDIKIEEVLQSSDLELAILSAFQFDMEWLFTKFRTNTTRFLFMMQAKDEVTKQQYENDIVGKPSIRLCFPPMDGQVNCMHSKLMLLYHPNYLRIVVPSANLTNYDWGEMGGIMENTVFLIDLPKISGTNNEAPKTAFYEDLTYFLEASTLHPSLIEKISTYDFTETARYAFVHTIGGSHTGETWKRTGHCGLGRAVDALGLRTQSPINIDFVTSSVGSLTAEFLRSIYLSAQGDDGSIEYTLRTSKTFPSKSIGNPTRTIQKTTGSDWKDHFRVYYPSQETVQNSKGGPGCAGTICFQEKWYNGPKFPQHVLHDCISRREKLLMHNKMLLARPETPINLPDGSTCVAWAYVGSANLSESAWGRLVQDRATKEPKLNCRNWECGVLVPITKVSESAVNDKQGKKEKEEENGDIEQIFNPIPVPMRVPAPSFSANPNLKPWYGGW
ncbi:tyrosyl-DNA phosphodiesterase-domain-containing protein [Talaromyces proteolyticus]|uniref:Tyrosyl-DNA phosphodiesterase-domain-containing protein n=1 Tax=Talaromyces proteolyticus TaxID=1131652 RepID=A0AAD4KHQ3_9EURO|nr:tyrosyl-DNA phosphodiesterase-domain-containing protein [Talaromyces proteolyticus]KAH8689649.1 tyrosyl-DNA phosphodiesterase-domain-containing protein [Talaromyces proteolyticus]